MLSGMWMSAIILLVSAAGCALAWTRPPSEMSQLTLCQRACLLPCHGDTTRSSCACVSDCATRTGRTIKESREVSLEPHMTGRDSRHNGSSAVRAVCNSRGMAFPTLLLLGVQKCGSTSMFYGVKESIPALIGPTRHDDDPSYFSKEVHFFTDPERYAQGADLYGSYYGKCDDLRRQGIVPVEGTPNYFLTNGPMMADPWVAAHKFFNAEIAPATDGAKGLTFVVIVRDPSSRYISAFNHFCIRHPIATMSEYCGGASLSPLDSVKKSVDDPLCNFSADVLSMDGCASYMLKGGIFWVPLTGWVELFPDARFIITTFSHYTKDPHSVHAEIGSALGGVEVVNVGGKRLNAADGNESLPADLTEATAMLEK